MIIEAKDVQVGQDLLTPDRDVMTVVKTEMIDDLVHMMVETRSGGRYPLVMFPHEPRKIIRSKLWAVIHEQPRNTTSYLIAVEVDSQNAFLEERPQMIAEMCRADFFEGDTMQMAEVAICGSVNAHRLLASEGIRLPFYYKPEV